MPSHFRYQRLNDLCFIQARNDNGALFGPIHVDKLGESRPTPSKILQTHYAVPVSKQEKAAVKRFDANVRRERTAKGWTQEQLAEWGDLNIRTVQKIEAGQINILLTTVTRIQRALGCPLNRLFKEEL